MVASTADKRNEGETDDEEEKEELRPAQTFQEVRPDPLNMLLILRVLYEEALVSLKQSGLQGNNGTLWRDNRAGPWLKGWTGGGL
ncbi:hypothetical protein VZT92_015212 [Zoarces viviparus]|uniref:Uncharacterized protein n=1 Tax=Zoarces viviparus TaxID=48416 RepID=A0AAW1EX17_ZOAVI